MNGRNVTFNNCTIQNIATDGLYIQSTIYTTSLNGTTIRDCGGSGITILNGNLTISSGSVENVVSHGLKIAGADATITNFDIKNVGADGLIISNAGTDVTADNLKVINSSLNGIYISSAGTVQIQNSYFLSNKKNGVYILTNNATFTSCAISDNRISGVFTKSANPVFTNCCVIGNYVGFFMVNATASSSVKFSTISGYMPFFLDNSFTVINNNNIYTSNETRTETINFSGTFYCNGCYSSPYSISTPIFKGLTEIYGNVNGSQFGLDLFDLDNTSLCDPGNSLGYHVFFSSSGQGFLRISGSSSTTYYSYGFTSIRNVGSWCLRTTNTTGTINAQNNYWGASQGVDALIFQTVANTVNYSNYSSGEIATAACNTTNNPPSINLTAPTGFTLNPATINITWTDEDLDNNASITFKRKNFSTGEIATITSGISENELTNSYTWNLTSVPDGIYQVFGIISDGINLPDTSFASGQVTKGILKAWIPNDLFSTPGSTVMVPVNVQNAIDFYNIISFQFTVSFNTAVAEPIAVITEETLTESWSVFYNNSIPGQISVNGFSTSNLIGTGPLVNILFQVKPNVANNTTTPLNFADFVFNENNPDPTVVDGSLLVLQSYIISGYSKYYFANTPIPGVKFTTSQMGTPVEVYSNSLGYYSFPQLISGNYTVTLSYSEAVPDLVITPYDASMVARFAIFLITLTNNQQKAADVSGDNSATAYDAALIAQYSVGLINSFTAGRWNINPINKQYNLIQNVTEQNYTFIAFGDPSGNWTAPAKNPPYENIINITAAEDEVFEVSIPADGSLYSFLVDIPFNPSEIEFLNYQVDASLNDFSAVSNIEENRLRISAYGVEEKFPTENLITLSFKALKDLQNYPLSISGLIDERELLLNPTAINALTNNQLGKIYPNPSDGNFYFPAMLAQDNKMSLSIMNYSGEVVKEYNYGGFTGNQMIEIKAEDLPSGIYLVKIILEKEMVAVQKITIIH